jgi:hypothetical protein
VQNLEKPTDRLPDGVYTQSTGNVGTAAIACGQCGSPFTPKRRSHNARFCSGRCRSQWHKARKAALMASLIGSLDRAGESLRELRERPAGGRPC